MPPNILQYLNIGSCPACNRKFRTENASIIEKNLQGACVQVDCKNCAASVMLTIMGNLEEDDRTQARIVAVVGMVTDLTQGDAKRLVTQKPITVDEALDVYELLIKPERKTKKIKKR